jgi:hypothetical protein
VQQREAANKVAQQANFDRRHKAKELPALTADDRVWVKDLSKAATVLNQVDKNPRSFWVKTNQATICRNRAGLMKLQN